MDLCVDDPHLEYTDAYCRLERFHVTKACVSAAPLGIMLGSFMQPSREAQQTGCDVRHPWPHPPSSRREVPRMRHIMRAQPRKQLDMFCAHYPMP
ncbi:hypothetical protein M8818_002400 [Zalaria obscura]|uniref:Uncharacterized protein n=1 Tax=Zalaria obscura TaxID=2024903 RepID=A0ACC3SIP5_9PEZI